MQRLRYASKGLIYYDLSTPNEVKIILPFIYIANFMCVISIFNFIITNSILMGVLSDSFDKGVEWIKNFGLAIYNPSTRELFGFKIPTMPSLFSSLLPVPKPKYAAGK